MRRAIPPSGAAGSQRPFPNPGDNSLALACSLVAAFLLATFTCPFQLAAPWHKSPTSERRWMKADTVLSIGLLIMAIEVLLFSYDYEAASAAAELGRYPRRNPEISIVFCESYQRTDLSDG
jgi:hypothetical protein